MQITYFSDYSLRVLLYLAVKEEKAFIAEISDALGTSRHHLKKAVHNLIKLGYVNSIRGKTGGILLAVPAESIHIGNVLQQLEPHMDIVECFNQEKDSCPITPVCRMKRAFGEAKDAFLQALNKYSLADLVENKKAMARYMAFSL